MSGTNTQFSGETPQGSEVVGIQEWTKHLLAFNTKLNNLFSWKNVANYTVRTITSLGLNPPILASDYLVYFNGSGITYTVTLPYARNVKSFVMVIGPSCGVNFIVSSGDFINGSATSIAPGSSTRTMFFSDGARHWFTK